MSRKDEISPLKAWLIVLASLIDDILVLGIVFLALRLFHVRITWWLIAVIGLAMVTNMIAAGFAGAVFWTAGGGLSTTAAKCVTA